MGERVLIIGAGILGASIAYHLQKSGASVTVVDAGQAGATSASFGWINASFYLDATHFRMRAAGISAYRELARELDIPVNWCGCLCFETEGAAFDQQRDDLMALGYEVAEIDRDQFRALEPHVAVPPERSLVFPQEAVAESGALAEVLLAAAKECGARVVCGVVVRGFATEGGRVVGVETDAGVMAADQVVSAVGTGTEALMASVDVPVPLLTRPGVMLRTQTLPTMLRHVLVSELGELRQLPDGSLMLPTAVAHQADKTEALARTVAEEADLALSRLQAFLPGHDLRWVDASLAYRPVPQDERPVVGPVMEGLYVVCAHSGITLAAALGQWVAQEMMQGADKDTEAMLSAYRPGRFAQ